MGIMDLVKINEDDIIFRKKKNTGRECVSKGIYLAALF